MDIGELHGFVLLIENKEQTAWHTPVEIDTAIHRSSMDLFWKYAPIYGEDEEAKTALDPFVQSFQVTPANSPAGIITLPQGVAFPSPLNYARLLSAMAVSYDNTQMKTMYFDIDMVNDDELPKRLMSQLKPVTIDRPIAKSTGKGTYQLYPQVPNTALFTYLALPVKPVYGYSQGGPAGLGGAGRVLTYLPGTSTQPQWNDDNFTSIIEKTLVYLGLNMDNDMLVNFMSQKTAGK